MSRLRCECGRLDDFGPDCDETLDLRTARRVAWVPESEQGSADASGTYTCGAYAEEAWVSPRCLDRWVRKHLDSMGEYGSVLRYGVAWLRRHCRAAYDRHLAEAEASQL